MHPTLSSLQSYGKFQNFTEQKKNAFDRGSWQSWLISMPYAVRFYVFYLLFWAVFRNPECSKNSCREMKNKWFL